MCNIPGGAHRSRSNPNLDDVSPRQQQLFYHLPSHYIACDDSFGGVGFTVAAHLGYEL